MAPGLHVTTSCNNSSGTVKSSLQKTFPIKWIDGYNQWINDWMKWMHNAKWINIYDLVFSSFQVSVLLNLLECSYEVPHDVERSDAIIQLP